MIFIHKWDKRGDPQKLAQDPHLPLRLRFSGSGYPSEWARESLDKVTLRSHQFSVNFTHFPIFLEEYHITPIHPHAW